MIRHQTAVSRSAPQTDLSGTRGAKQDVVVITQRTLAAPSRPILSSMAATSVRSSSPSSRFSTTTGSKPDNRRRLRLVRASFAPRSHLVRTSFAPRSHLVRISFTLFTVQHRFKKIFGAKRKRRKHSRSTAINAIYR